MLIQNDVELKGSTTYTGLPSYESHDSKQALVLQDHSDLVSYRNIWIREIDLDAN